MEPRCRCAVGAFMLRRVVLLFALASLLEGCSSEHPHAASSPIVTSSPTTSPTGVPKRTSPFLVPAAVHVASDPYRCNGRPLAGTSYPSTLDATMNRIRDIESKLAALPKERLAKRYFFVGLRTCGQYRSLVMGESIYDANGALVAVLESMDVVDPACGRDPESATIHYGQAIDCDEAELLYP
jgi:hypothetical protein